MHNMVNQTSNTPRNGAGRRFHEIQITTTSYFQINIVSKPTKRLQNTDQHKKIELTLSISLHQKTFSANNHQAAVVIFSQTNILHNLSTVLTIRAKHTALDEELMSSIQISHADCWLHAAVTICSLIGLLT